MKHYENFINTLGVVNAITLSATIAKSGKVDRNDYFNKRK
ncbi:hypothetical protein SAMN06295960_1991 [Paenibacillus aquistagni]|uniref:Uncharacterized protein n=1 Tax=Paenibacillus aquistagni TaxID=1852522 RepID=A0A1X7K2K3_9BACL|nr:hypothetical protein SAMN06295960_1991 [Paenibacillus aquistagni]